MLWPTSPETDAKPPAQDVLEGLDLSSWGDRYEAVVILEDMLASGGFLQWEAVEQEELGLPMSGAQVEALENLFGPSDAEDDDPIHYIDGSARPAEPWYESVRRLASELVIDRFETAAIHHVEETTLGGRLLDAVEQYGKNLSLPEGCRVAVEVVPAQVRHRLRVQCAFDALGGIGQRFGKLTGTLADPEQRYRIEDFAEAFEENAASLDALGWTLDDLLNLVVFPEGERSLLIKGLKEVVAQGHTNRGVTG